MIQFQLTINDILNFNSFYLKKRGSFLQKYLHWGVLLFFVIFMVVNLYESHASTLSYFIIVPFVAIVVILQKYLSKFLRRKSIVKFLKKNPFVIATRTFEIEETELLVTIDDSKTNFPYSNFHSLEETTEYFYAFVSLENAVIIPKRLINKHPEINDLIQKIRKGIS